MWTGEYSVILKKHFLPIWISKAMYVASESIMLGTKGRQKWCENSLSHMHWARIYLPCWCWCGDDEKGVGFQDNASMHPMWHVFIFSSGSGPCTCPPSHSSFSLSPPPHPLTSKISSFPQWNSGLYTKIRYWQCNAPTTIQFRRAVTRLVSTSIQDHSVQRWLVATTVLLAIQQSQGASHCLGFKLC